MLASSLIARFVGPVTLPSPATAATSGRLGSGPSARFMALYATAFAVGVPTTALPESCPPPGASVGHARQMAATLIEWAQRLDAAGIQVHQEGAVARFLGALEAPVFGRHPGAVGTRAKTIQFYADVLRASVDASRSRTYLIPAASWQGASVALTEASASAQAFHTARAALDAPTQEWPTDRPELAHLAAQAPVVDRAALEREAGRAAAMHTTAMAEAIGCLRVAEGGAWLRVVQTPADLAAMGQGLIVGVEVAAGPLNAALVANLDPQHGGGTFGLGFQPVGALAACDAAVQAVTALGSALPVTTRFVTTRMDPDALVAAMVLSGRVPLPLAQAAAQGIRELAELDSSRPVAGGWQPGTRKPQTVADHPLWGAVGTLCYSYTRGGEGAATLADLEAAVLASLQQTPARLAAEQDRVRSSWAQADILAQRVQVAGVVAAGMDFPVGPVSFVVLYERAPIGVLVTDTFNFRSPSGTVVGRKFTVGASRDLGEVGAAFTDAFRRQVARLEPGWSKPGDGGTISGSPMSGPSRLDLATVLGLAHQTAAMVGVVGAHAVTPGAPTTLR